MLKKIDVIHYPNLKTVLAVEKILKNSKQVIKRKDLKEKLENKIMHQTLNIILEYLEESGKIIDGRKGILWVHNSSPKIKKAIRDGIEL